jgi:hypothetical protein
MKTFSNRLIITNQLTSKATELVLQALCLPLLKQFVNEKEVKFTWKRLRAIELYVINTLKTKTKNFITIGLFTVILEIFSRFTERETPVLTEWTKPLLLVFIGHYKSPKELYERMHYIGGKMEAEFQARLPGDNPSEYYILLSVSMWLMGRYRMYTELLKSFAAILRNAETEEERQKLYELYSEIKIALISPAVNLGRAFKDVLLMREFEYPENYRAAKLEVLNLLPSLSDIKATMQQQQQQMCASCGEPAFMMDSETNTPLCDTYCQLLHNGC